MKTVINVKSEISAQATVLMGFIAVSTMISTNSMLNMIH